MATYAQRKADRVAGPAAESAGLAVHEGLNARSAVTQAKATAARLNARAETVQRKPSRSDGLPDPLRANMEAMSGIALDDVTVHRNSDKPAQMQAHAYAQGTDIHLAPGQDRYLPHEAWHVVQQKQGRVHPTRQMKRGDGVNDDPSLEREADTMGARPSVSRIGSTGHAAPAAARQLSRAPPVQGKFDVAIEGQQGAASEEILPILYKHLTTLLEKPELAGKVPDVRRLGEKIPQLLSTMMTEETDHGVFDLDSEQGVAFLAFAIQNLTGIDLETGKPLDRGKSRNSAKPGKVSEKSSQSPGPLSKMQFETLFLGRGASTAYWLAAGRGTYSASNSRIVGGDDPWAGKRGAGVVAHPENMISPLLTFVGREVDNVWTERGRFAGLVREAIERSGVPQEHGTIAKIAETDGGYAVTLVDGRILTARNVVSGLGSGEHQRPSVKNKAHVAEGPENVAPSSKTASKVGRRVMNMDIFTQVADRLYLDNDVLMLSPPGAETSAESRAGIHIVLSGGNGGIDVAFTALQKGFRVSWLVGDGPSFLEGFFNYAAKYAYERSDKYDPKTNSSALGEDTAARTEQIRAHLAELYAGQNHPLFADVVDRFAQSTKFERVYLGRAGAVQVDGHHVRVTVAGAPEKAAPVGHLFVYAHGQDLAALHLIEPSLLRAMKPLVDANLRFFNPLGSDSREVQSQKKAPVDTVLGMRHDSARGGGSLKLIGASGYRHREQDSEAMAPVIKDLPPNVLLNDQLTPTRSQVEASLGYVRPTIGSFANFASDDRTQLAVHIAARYPFIPAKDLVSLTFVIVKSRKLGLPTLPEIKAVPPYTKQFQAYWISELGRLNLLNRPLMSKL